MADDQGAATQQLLDTVDVVSPEGQTGSVPRANLQTALSRNFKVAPPTFTAPTTPDRVDVISPEGKYGTLPKENLPTAQQRGFKQAVYAESPEGQARWLPQDTNTIKQAQQRGFKFGQWGQQGLGPPQVNVQPAEGPTSVWQYANTPLVAGRTMVNAGEDLMQDIDEGLGGKQRPRTDTYAGLKQAARHLDPDHPYLQAAKTFAAGALTDTADTGAQMATSPTGIALAAAGPLGEGAEAVNAMRSARALRAIQAGAGVGFGAQGAGQVYNAVTDPNITGPEAWQQGLTGASMMAGGAAGTGELLKQTPPALRNAAARVTPEFLKNAAKASGIGLSPEEMIRKAGGPSVTGQEGENLGKNLRIAGPRLVEQDGIRKIQSVQDMADGAYMAANRVWNDGYEPQIARHANVPVDLTGIGDQIRDAVSPATRKLFPEQGEKADAFADKFNDSVPLSEAGDYLHAINAQLKSFYKMSPEARAAAGLTDGNVASLESAAEGLRDSIDKTLEAHGEADPGGLRREYGALKGIQKIFDKRAVVHGRAKPFDLAQLGSIAAGAAEAGGAAVAGLSTGHPLAAAAGVAAGALPLAATTLFKHLNSSDTMVRRAIQGLRETAEPARPLNSSRPAAVPPPQLALPPGQYNAPSSPLGPVMQQFQQPQLPERAGPGAPRPDLPRATGPFPMQPGRFPESRQLPGMTLPERLPEENPAIHLNEPSASAAQQRTLELEQQGRGAWRRPWEVGRRQTPTPTPEAPPTGPETSPQGTSETGPLFSPETSSKKPPQTVGTDQGAQRDTELFQQAQRENPKGTVSQWAQRAQELKQQDEQPPQEAALHSPASAEDDLEAARRGAAGAPPSDRVQRATDLVNSLTMQLDRERAAGDPGQYLTVSHLSNAQDALQVAQSSDQLFAGKRPSKEVQGHNAAVGSMLLDVTHPPQSIDWNVVKPGRGLPSALELNDAARELVAKSIGTRGFGGMSASPETLDQEVLPRLEMAAQAMDNTRAQRSDYFDPQASAKLRQLAQAIQENRGPEGLSFTRSEGTPEQQRYTTHEELFHTAVQRRPAGGVGLRVPDISDSAGMELMRPRIYKETGRMTSIVHHAEGMADIMQGRAPELTPEQAGQTAEDYWDQLAATGPSGVKGLLDAWRLENFMDDDQESKGYTLDDNVHAIRQAGRDALARVLSRHFGENLRGLARALREEPEGGNVSRAQGSPNPANDVPPANGPPDLGSAAANTGSEGAGPSSGAVAPPQQASLFNEKQRVSTRRPTGVTSTEDPMKQDLQINTQAIRDAGLEKSMADRVREYVGQKNLSGTPSEILDGFKKHLTDNLVWLHNQLPENFRAQSKQWYDGANKLAGDWSKQYSNDEQKVSKPQVAGVIASLSPQKDWHMNVSLAQRTIDTYLNHQDTPFSPEMKAASQRLAQTHSLRPDLKQIAGKTLSDLSDPIQKAMWIRLYDEAHNSRSYNVYAPDGSVSDLARNQDGAPSKVAWGSNAMTAKAISILEDGSRQNISDQLGDMHKVRNFYNNIVAPNSKSGDVTIDTHAVAAAHLRPLAGGDIEVQHNFGNTNKGTEGVGQSQIAGIKGTYGIYADAYRAAAEKLGVLPRELQSMTWEGIRSLFPAEYKTAANKAIIDGIWSDYQNGKLSIAQARRQVVKAAGGFTPPEWAAGGRSDAGAHEAAGPAPESPDVSGAGVHGQPTGSAPSRGGSSSARAVSESVNPSASPVPQFLKRAARPNVSSR